MMQEFVQRVIEIAREEAKGIHTAFPGRIVAFDPEKGLATIQPLLKYRSTECQLCFRRETGRDL